MGKIERGRIVRLTNVIDSAGNPTEDHRAVILTTKGDYNAGKPIKAAYISSNFHISSADNQIRLPHAKGGHPQTGLNRPSAVMCDLRNEDVDEDSIISYERMVYGSLLQEIMAKVDELVEKGR